MICDLRRGLIPCNRSFKGGAWGNDVSSCLQRKNTRLGSSKLMVKQMAFSGIFGNKPATNPDLYNWNKVRVRYCDGSSFTGDVEAVDPVRIFFEEFPFKALNYLTGERAGHKSTLQGRKSLPRRNGGAPRQRNESRRAGIRPTTYHLCLLPNLLLQALFSECAAGDGC